MDAGVLLKECLNCFSINPALLVASIIDVGNVVFSQEGSEILGVPNIIALSQYCRLFYISNLPFVSTGQSKKDVKRPYVLKHRLQFHPLDTPIPW